MDPPLIIKGFFLSLSRSSTELNVSSHVQARTRCSEGVSQRSAILPRLRAAIFVWQHRRCYFKNMQPPLETLGCDPAAVTPRRRVFLSGGAADMFGHPFQDLTCNKPHNALKGTIIKPPELCCRKQPICCCHICCCLTQKSR